MKNKDGVNILKQSAAKEQEKEKDPDDLKRQKQKLMNELSLHKLMDHENIC